MKLLSVNVGQPVVIGSRRGHPVRSAIDKRPVAPTLGGLIDVGAHGLQGDAQADRKLHGGGEKAVYAYPGEHAPAWDVELGRTPRPGSFGENLTTLGVTEGDVWIGDVWAWGDALLQVCQPRTPCAKLSLVTGTTLVTKRMWETAWCGWYLRVLRPAAAPVTSSVEVVERGAEGVSVRDAFRACRPGQDGIERVLDAVALSDEWRRELTRRRVSTPIG